MSTTRLRETEAARERERILSTPLSRKPSDSCLQDSPSTDLSLLSPPGLVLVKQTPVHHYNLRTLQPGPGYGYTPKWSSTPLSCLDSGSCPTPSETRVQKISSSPAVLGSDQAEEVKDILDFKKRLDVIDCQDEVDSGFESLIQNEDEKLIEDAAAQVGEDSVVASSSSEMKASLGAVAKRTSPRNKQKPRTDRLGRKSTSKTGPVLSSVVKDFSREGQEVCDFVRHLHHDVLETLFSYLSDHDLYRVAQVSTTWRAALLASKTDNERRLTFISNKKLERENLGKENFLCRRISPRRAMVDIINRTSPNGAKRDRNHSASILVSPSKVRHKLFLEEGKKLSDGERLVKCPTCFSPSRVTRIPVSADSPPAVTRQKEKATCSSPQCSFVFCPECQCEDHPARPCRARRSGSKLSKSGGVTSQKSKNRLRRL